MVGIKTDRSAVLVGSPIKTKYNHSRLTHKGVGRHGGWFKSGTAKRSPNLWMSLHSTLEIKQSGNASVRWIRIDDV